jgi:hypothetical protein
MTGENAGPMWVLGVCGLDPDLGRGPFLPYYDPLGPTSAVTMDHKGMHQRQTADYVAVVLERAGLVELDREPAQPV